MNSTTPLNNPTPVNSTIPSGLDVASWDLICQAPPASHKFTAALQALWIVASSWGKQEVIAQKIAIKIVSGSMDGQTLSFFSTKQIRTVHHYIQKLTAHEQTREKIARQVRKIEASVLEAIYFSCTTEAKSKALIQMHSSIRQVEKNDAPQVNFSRHTIGVERIAGFIEAFDSITPAEFMADAGNQRVKALFEAVVASNPNGSFEQFQHSFFKALERAEVLPKDDPSRIHKAIGDQARSVFKKLLSAEEIGPSNDI